MVVKSLMLYSPPHLLTPCYTLTYADSSELFELSLKRSKHFQLSSKSLKAWIYNRGTVRTIAIALLAGAAIITSDHIIDG